MKTKSFGTEFNWNKHPDYRNLREGEELKKGDIVLSVNQMFMENFMITEVNDQNSFVLGKSLTTIGKDLEFEKSVGEFDSLLSKYKDLNKHCIFTVYRKKG